MVRNMVSGMADDALEVLSVLKLVSTLDTYHKGYLSDA
jgi:hypothetical protein